MTDSSKNTITKLFCTDSIKNSKRLTPSVLTQQYDIDPPYTMMNSLSVNVRQIRVKD